MKKSIPPEASENANQTSLQAARDEMISKVTTWHSKYLPNLLFQAYQILENEQDAEDIVSSLFERLIHNIDKQKDSALLLSENEVIGYLKISVRNACVDHIRSNKRKSNIFSQVGNGLQFWKRPEVYDNFQNEAIELMLVELSDREKQIFRMHLDGHKNEEIAKTLNLSDITIRNTLHNARKRIRKIWHIFMH